MKKVILFFMMIFTLCTTLAFADKSRFFESGKVIDTMFIDSPEGLRVRDKPSLKSNRLCSVPHRLPVKIVAIGKEEKIDCITAPWVEILVPRYEWKGENPEYGWVFGGYLKEKQPEFIKPATKEELKNYLTSFFYWVKLSEREWQEKTLEDFFTLNWRYDIYTCFSQNNYYRDCADKSYGDGTFKVIDSETLDFRLKGYDYEGDYESPDLDSSPLENVTRETIKVLTENSFIIKFEDYEMMCAGFTFYGRELNIESPCLYMTDFTGLDKYSELEWVTKELNVIVEKYGSENSQNTDYLCNGYYMHNVSVDQAVNDFIKFGISAKGTKYEDQYHDYWNPIMAEHQKKADAMK